MGKITIKYRNKSPEYINVTVKDQDGNITWCNHVNTHLENETVYDDIIDIVDVCDVCWEVV